MPDTAVQQIVIDPGLINRLMQSVEMAKGFGDIAEGISGQVDLPSSNLSLRVRSGVGPRGVYSQVIMNGPGAIAIEFGTRYVPPQAPLRRALGTFSVTTGSGLRIRAIKSSAAPKGKLGGRRGRRA